MPIWPFGKNSSPAQPAPATDSNRSILSILSPEEAKALGGLPVEAMLGEVATDDKGMRRETFVPNPRFIEFMHQVIQTAGPLDEGLQAVATAQGEGWVYIIDLRTPEGPQGRVPAEDIIGGFEVNHGHILPASYWANEDHRLLTANGIVVLPESLRAAWVKQLPSVNE